MISFLSPLFLLGAAAAALPILLHLLKRQPENRVRFSAVHLLRSAPVENTSRRRLRQLLLLALRVTALLLLALAFARPFMAASDEGSSSGVTIVALDTSLSMSAPGQFERAKQLARAAVQDAPSGDAVGVVTFGDLASVAAGPSGDRGMAAAAVDAARAGFGSTRYRAGLNAAADTFQGRRGRIVVVTDLLESGWDAGDRAAVPESAAIEVVDVGAPPPNMAVTSARVSGDRIVASVRNGGQEARDARVRLTINAGPNDSRLAGETTIPVAANQSAEVSFASAPGEWAAVAVDDRGGIEGDDTRFVVLGNAGRPKVLVVTSTGDLGREAFYLQQALMAAGPAGTGYDVAGVAARELASWDQARIDSHLAIALTSTKTLERRGRELIAQYFRSGGGVLLTAGADVDGEIVAETLGGERVTLVTPSTAERDMQVRSFAPADGRHPVFRSFGAGASALGLVQFHRITTVRADGCSTLARFTSGEAALVDCASGEGRALVLASDLDNRWNDFPLHSTFVPFVHEAIRYLSGGRTSASDYLVDTVPAGLAPVPGVVPLNAAQSAPRLVAVNVDPAETLPARLTAEEFGTAVTRLKDVAATGQRADEREREERQHIWQYALGLMVTMLIVESAIAMRTA
ncbi:MAG: VWA domain-containing protein [Luteitalea sp.]|nr:VWA domain-containing protein [Luteitalea sp.]